MALFGDLFRRPDPVGELTKAVERLAWKIEALKTLAEQMNENVKRLLAQGNQSMTIQEELVAAVTSCTTSVDAFIAFVNEAVSQRTITRAAADAMISALNSRRDAMEAAIQNGLQPPANP